MRPSQFLENVWKFWNGSPLEWLDPFPLLNVALYWKSSKAKACAKKLLQILANNIDNGARGDWSQNLCEVISKKINEK